MTHRGVMELTCNRCGERLIVPIIDRAEARLWADLNKAWHVTPGKGNWADTVEKDYCLSCALETPGAVTYRKFVGDKR